MSVLAVLQRLRQQPEMARCITHWEELEARQAAYAPVPESLHPRLRAALRARGIEALYTHQVASVEAAVRGEHFVVVTPTASGKTLCYNLPVLDALLAEPEARALYLFPTKALAQDQRHELHRLIEETGAPVSAELYDGDTPASARRGIRASARIVITNPDMLHTGILPHHTSWLSLWTNLRYIVIDEVHQYRGLFGSHFANLLRRLRRLARFYGCDPQIIAASATIANPGDLVERLIDAETPATVIDENGAPRGRKHFVFWNPPPYNEQLGLRRSSLLEARRVAATFLQEDVQTIVFSRSRLSTEVLLRYLQEDGQRLGMREGTVRGYRGGYLPLERRAIEQGLRAGEVRSVVSTNALELGIDIGQLDACIIHGYPGTIASVWQQAGRAGRRTGTSAALLVASSHPLDQFIIRHPQWFFAASPEHARINPDNLLILVNHLKCAAFELPFAPGEGFGAVAPEVVREILAFLEEEGLVHSAADTYYWTAESYPAEGISLRMAGNDGLLITAQPGGVVIGQVERYAAHQMCHPGAIYMHEGRQFLIGDIDMEAARAYATPVEVDYYTRAQSKSSVALVETYEVDESAGRYWGEVLVTSRVTGFKKIKLHTHETLGTYNLALPESKKQTTCYWITFPVVAPDIEKLDYGPTWRQQRLRARGRDGFRCANCRIHEDELGRELDVHHRIPFRDFGYVPGRNDGYLAANDLSNLISLCPSCHRAEEQTTDRYAVTGGRSALAAGLLGVANALGNISPLFLMCDAHDLGVSSELRSPQTGRPTIFLYDMVPSGVGFAEQLYALHDDLLHAATSLIRDCPCTTGCPACVGPDGMVGENGKQHALDLLTSLSRLT
jgi:DEAD/DEAH box helicase domain-containing protein